MVIAGDAVDEAATASLRAASAGGELASDFDFGLARRAFEQVWTRERYALLTVFLAEAPVLWRHFLKHKVFAAVAKDAHAARPLPEQMAAIFADLRAQFAGLAVAA